MPDPMPIPGTNQSCWISPADLAGQVDNLLTRVSKLESALSRLIGADVTAINLENICPAYGTLIAPPSGNGFIQWDSVTKTWIVTDLGMSGGGAAPKYATVTYSYSGTPGALPGYITPTLSELTDPDNIVTVSGTSCTLTNAGTYLISMYLNYGIASTSGVNSVSYWLAPVGDPATIPLFSPVGGNYIPTGITTIRYLNMGASARVEAVTAGTDFQVSIRMSTGSSGAKSATGAISILKLA